MDYKQWASFNTSVPFYLIKHNSNQPLVNRKQCIKEKRMRMVLTRIRWPLYQHDSLANSLEDPFPVSYSKSMTFFPNRDTCTRISHLPISSKMQISPIWMPLSRTNAIHPPQNECNVCTLIVATEFTVQQ